MSQRISGRVSPELALPTSARSAENVKPTQRHPLLSSAPAELAGLQAFGRAPVDSGRAANAELTVQVQRTAAATASGGPNTDLHQQASESVRRILAPAEKFVGKAQTQMYERSIMALYAQPGLHTSPTFLAELNAGLLRFRDAIPQIDAMHLPEDDYGAPVRKELKSLYDRLASAANTVRQPNLFTLPKTQEIDPIQPRTSLLTQQIEGLPWNVSDLSN